MGEPNSPQPGDRIVFGRADGRFDVLEITKSGTEKLVRGEEPTLDIARDIGHMSDGGRLWWRHHSKPDVTAPYKIGK